jgi:UPF0271 protein
MMVVIDLNCDMGEGSAVDAQLIPLMTSASIACGGHAGDEQTMRESIRLALTHGVSLGAHPSYPDREGFGRRAVRAAPDQIRADLAVQIQALATLASEAGAALRHVKPHGALYNQAMSDRALTEAIGAAVVDVDSSLIVVVLAGSPHARVLEDMGLRVAREAFIDRAYTAAGTLVSRDLPGAVITDAHYAAVRAVRMVRDGTTTAVDGTELNLRPDTLCIHSDTPGAVAIAQAVRAALREADVSIVALPEVISDPGPRTPDPGFARPS